MDSVFWNGERLRNGSDIAVALIADETSQSLVALGFAAATQAESVWVTQQQFARFLLLHGDRQFICRNAAQFHWLMDRFLKGNSETAGVVHLLWRLSREGRLIDLELFDHLVRAAQSDGDPPGHSWEEIVVARVGATITTPQELATKAAAIAGESSEVLLQQNLNVLGFEAQFAQIIYQALIAETRNLPSVATGANAGEQFGPLGLAIQVKARIAASAPAGQFRLERAPTEEALSEWTLRRIQIAARVRTQPELRNCYSFSGDSRDVDYVAVKRRALARFLKSRQTQSRGQYGVLQVVAAGANGRLLLDPAAWGVLSNCDPLLYLWSRLDQVGNILGFFRRYSGQVIIPKYDYVLPRLTCCPKAHVVKASVDAAILRSSSGDDLVQFEIVDVELRALAAYCEFKFGTSRLADAFRRREDPAQLLTQRLGDDATCEVARIAIGGLALQLGSEQLEQLLLNSGVRAINPRTVMALRDETFQLFPELECYADDLIERLTHNLRARRDDVARCLPDRVTASRAVKEICGMKRPGQVFDCLKQLNQNSSLLLPLYQPGKQLAHGLLTMPSILPTGRRRGPSLFAEGTAPHLDLADDAIKSAVFEIVAVNGSSPLIYGNILAVPHVTSRGQPVKAASLVTAMRIAVEAVLLGLPCEVRAHYAP